MNKKAFTLVELLASLVILGVLMLVAVPTVTSLINDNRAETYLEDAKRFVSNVEYSLKTNTNINLPTKNNCIIISLEYLESPDFDNSPSGGEYDAKKSFVVVKNINDSYEYSVRLIESLKTKGYRGVKLAKYKDLSGKNAQEKVVGLKESETFSIDSSLINTYNSNKSYITSATSCNNISSAYYIN